MIYLASPYTHADPDVREQRFDQVCRSAAELIRDGVHLFAPIAHSHPIARYGLHTGFEFWREMDEHMIGLCSEVWVLMLDGWDESVGVKHEIAFAHGRGKVVRYIRPSLSSLGLL